VHLGLKPSLETRKRMSKAQTGRKHSQKTKDNLSKKLKKIMGSPEYKKQDREKRIKMRTFKKQSKTMKEKIAKGEFTPCVTNSWANSRCKLEIDGFNKKYRSSWDAAFQILNPNCEYEKIRIPYISPEDNDWHNYITDFVDEDNKIIYEIKPDKLQETEVNKAKAKYAVKWTKENNYQYIIISNKWFKENSYKINFDKYDEKIFKGMKQFL
jgi:hypothetical protein